MKKTYLLLPLILGAAIALFLVFRNYSKTADSAAEHQRSAQEAGSHVTAAQWDESKGSSSVAANSETGRPGDSGSNAAQGPKAELANKLVNVSGIGRKFMSMAPMLKEQLEMMISDQLLSEKERDELMQKFRKNISAEKLLADYNAKLAETFSDEELNQLVTMYEDPQVKRFNQLNNDLSDPDKIRDIQDDITEFMKDADLKSVAPERLKQFERIDRGFNVSNQAIDLTNSLFNLAGEGSNPEANKQMDEAMKREIYKGFLYTTREFSDGDMASFADTVDNPNFAKANVLVHEVVKKPLMDWMKAMQEDLKKQETKKGSEKSPSPADQQKSTAENNKEFSG